MEPRSEILEWSCDLTSTIGVRHLAVEPRTSAGVYKSDRRLMRIVRNAGEGKMTRPNIYENRGVKQQVVMRDDTGGSDNTHRTLSY